MIQESFGGRLIDIARRRSTRRQDRGGGREAGVGRFHNSMGRSALSSSPSLVWRSRGIFR
jgi:hypothetical protein